MSILVNESTRVVIQGITGKEGSFQAQRCIEYGTKVVAGVTPGRGGQDFEGVPVFDTMTQAVKQTRAGCSLIFVPPAFAAVQQQGDAAGDVDWSVHFVDGSVIRAHQHAAGAKGGTQKPRRWGAARAASRPRCTSRPRARASR